MFWEHVRGTLHYLIKKNNNRLIEPNIRDRAHTINNIYNNNRALWTLWVTLTGQRLQLESDECHQSS